MNEAARSGNWRVICDYSGFKCWASETVKTWNGYRVLRRFAGEEMNRPAQDLVRGVPDNQAVPFARPEAADVFLSSTVTPNDL